MRHYSLLLFLLLAFIHGSNGNGSLLSRGRRKPWTDPIFVGRGTVCTSKKDVQLCTELKSVIENMYNVKFNKVGCSKNMDTNHRRQCHLQYKPSKTTDFECYMYNTSDGTGDVKAKCRSPWGTLKPGELGPGPNVAQQYPPNQPCPSPYEQYPSPYEQYSSPYQQYPSYPYGGVGYY